MKSVAPILLSLLFIGAIIVFVIALTLYSRRKARERTEHLRAVANLLGWQFGHEAPMDWIPGMNNFGLFNSGHSKRINNIMYGHANGVKAALFDYTYTTGSGKHQSTHYQSVAYFEHRDLNLPFFSLRPENFMHKLISALGYQDIDFNNRPTFSSQYLLRGNDEQRIRSTFDDALLAFYEVNPGVSTDGGGNQIFVFREGHHTPPEQIRAFIDWAAELQRRFLRHF
ncbi:MAG TPA: hypothetical protein VNO50_08750 [Pyrinomonadaceae bacterium]|nr:hypothetical protein [Pyrinomonadaceae bacterium]